MNGKLKLKEIAQEISERFCGGSEAITESIFATFTVFLQAQLAEERTRATEAEHQSHAKFDAELYATLVDPVECSAANEAEQRAQLLDAARRTRQQLVDLQSQVQQERAKRGELIERAALLMCSWCREYGPPSPTTGIHHLPGDTTSCCHAAAIRALDPSASQAFDATWRCFHCGYVAYNREDALAHFGDQDEEEALCQMWSALDADGRASEYQSTLRELEGEREVLDAMQQREKKLTPLIVELIAAGHRASENCPVDAIAVRWKSAVVAYKAALAESAKETTK